MKCGLSSHLSSLLVSQDNSRWGLFLNLVSPKNSMSSISGNSGIGVIIIEAVDAMPEWTKGWDETGASPTNYAHAAGGPPRFHLLHISIVTKHDVKWFPW